MKLRSNLLVGLVSFLGGLEASDVNVLVVDCDPSVVILVEFVVVNALETCCVG